MRFLFFSLFLNWTFYSHAQLSPRWFEQYELFGQDSLTMIPSDDGKNLPIRIYIPDSVSNKTPVLVALHWSGNEDSHKAFMDCLILPAMKAHGTIIIAPSMKGGVWWQGRSENYLQEMVSYIRQFWIINKEAIFVSGYSNGAIGGWFFLTKYPKLFNGAILIAGNYYHQGQSNVPIYFIHGEQDELFPATQNRHLIESNAPNSVYKRIQKLSHYVPCSYAKELAKGWDWINSK